MSRKYCLLKPETIFLRKASGLARDWSLADYTIYNAFNPIVWGIYVVAFSAFWTSSNFLLGFALIFVFGTFQAIVYAGMTSAMPRAGGDYVFQTRVFGRFRVAGYVMCWVVYAVGFPMSLILICTPVVWRYITPLALLAGMSYDSVVFWSSKSGLFISFVIQMIIGLTLTCLGLKWIARIQKIVYLLSMIGLFLIPLSFLSVSKEFFAQILTPFITMCWERVPRCFRILCRLRQALVGQRRSTGISWKIYL